MRQAQQQKTHLLQLVLIAKSGPGCFRFSRHGMGMILPVSGAVETGRTVNGWIYLSAMVCGAMTVGGNIVL
jgi:hypothetical protein